MNDLTPTRPRVAGDREQEILEAALEVLAEVGYDRLTMDAVAAAARASKATLYRRWNNKVSLIIEALACARDNTELPDTGSLRDDLHSLFCGMEGLLDRRTVRMFASVITAISVDPEFAAAFRRDVVGPKMAMSQQVWQRARDRGEIAAEIDIALLEPALVGIVMHRVLVLGETPDPTLVTRVIDQIILPAAARGTRPNQPALNHPTSAEDPS